MANLELLIGADISDLLKKIDLTEKQLKDLEKLSQKTGKGFQKGISGATKGMDHLGKATSANAVPAVQEFSRVIQDAPYGIQGVANNIQQLTANFGNLAKKTGSTKAALKAMVGSLVGPAGVLLAVSVVTSLLVSFGDELFKSGKQADNSADGLKDYVDALNSIDRARVKGTQSAAKELTNLRLLKDQVENTNLSQEDRLKALKELRKIYPNYLKGMTDEKALAGGLSETYNSLKTSILEKARAQAAASIITDNEIKKIAIENKLLEKQEQLNKKQAILAKTATTGTPTSPFGGGGLSNPKEQAQQDVNDAIAEEKKLKEEILKIDQENLKLQERIGDVTPFSGKGGKKPDLKKESKDYSSYLRKLENEIFKEGLELEPIDLSGIDFKGAPDIDPFAGMSTEIESGYKEIIDEADALMAKQKQLANVSSAVGQSVSNSLSSLGSNAVDSLGLASTGMEGFVGSLSKTVTTLIAQMLAASISQSIAGATASGTATGPAAVFSTPAFIATAVGGVLGAFAAIPSFAKGGFSGDNNLIRVNGNEAILRPFEQSQFMNIVKGGAMSGIAKNESESLVFIPKIVLRGDKQQVQFNRSKKRMNRLFNS